MRFEARELAPYAKPVKASDLIRGETYFIVTFADERMLVPEMKPVIFVGVDLAEEGENQLYFQDYGDYHREDAHSGATQDDRLEFDVCSPDDLGFVLNTRMRSRY